MKRGLRPCVEDSEQPPFKLEEGRTMRLSLPRRIETSQGNLPDKFHSEVKTWRRQGTTTAAVEGGTVAPRDQMKGGVMSANRSSNLS